MDMSIVIKLSTEIKVPGKILLPPTGVYPAHPTSLPTDLAITSKPARVLLQLPPRLSISHGARFPLHRLFRPCSPGSRLYTDTCHSLIITLTRTFLPLGSLILCYTRKQAFPLSLLSYFSILESLPHSGK